MRPRLGLAPILVVALVALVAFACGPRDTTVFARQAIDATNARWAYLTAGGHADSIADFYHANGVLYPPNMPAVRSRDSIRAFFAVLNTASSPPPTLVVRTESIWAAGPSATELGRWTFTWPAGARRPPGAPPADSGKYIVRWVKEGDRWLMMHDIWNSDLAMPTP